MKYIDKRRLFLYGFIMILLFGCLKKSENNEPNKTAVMNNLKELGMLTEKTIKVLNKLEMDLNNYFSELKTSVSINKKFNKKIKKSEDIKAIDITELQEYKDKLTKIQKKLYKDRMPLTNIRDVIVVEQKIDDIISSVNRLDSEFYIDMITDSDILDSERNIRISRIEELKDYITRHVILFYEDEQKKEK